MQTYLYRVREADEDGDPFDVGIITVPTEQQLTTTLCARLWELFEQPGRVFAVRCYPTHPPARGAGLWLDSDAYFDLDVELERMPDQPIAPTERNAPDQLYLTQLLMALEDDGLMRDTAQSNAVDRLLQYALFNLRDWLTDDAAQRDNLLDEYMTEVHALLRRAVINMKARKAPEQWEW